MDYYPRTNTTSRPRNFLFRGNMPIVNGTFGYSSVVDTMKKVANANKLSIPDPFIFVDVRYKHSIIIHSLIICTTEVCSHSRCPQNYDVMTLYVIIL